MDTRADIDLEQFGREAADAALGPGKAHDLRVRRWPDLDDGFSYKFSFLVDRDSDDHARIRSLMRLSRWLRDNLEARGDTHFAFSVFPTPDEWARQTGD